MADQHKDEKEAPVVITLSALKEMLSTLVAEMKKPVVDHELVARNLAAKLRLRAQREESKRDLDAIQNACPHLRGDGTSTIAWATNYHRARQLYVQEGPCQHCNKFFHPWMEDKAEYLAALKRPVGQAGIIQ
jgi:hypothetical protein